jgi:hypothetical protein
MKRKVKLYPLNPYRGGVARTIKANCAQVSLSNFRHTASFAASGVVVEYERAKNN